MKKYLLALSITSTIVSAQPSQADMEKMMAGMQEMQVCMSKIDMASLKPIQQESLKIKEKLINLCKQGKRDKAQEIAVDFSKKMMNMPALQQMKECTKDFKSEKIYTMEEKLKNNNVCDTDFGIK